MRKIVCSVFAMLFVACGLPPANGEFGNTAKLCVGDSLDCVGGVQRRSADQAIDHIQDCFDQYFEDRDPWSLNIEDHDEAIDQLQMCVEGLIVDYQ